MIRALWIGLAVLLLGAFAAGVVAVLELRDATAPPTPQEFVNATWSVYRFGPGHRKHVEGLHLECNACHRPTDGGFDRPGPSPCMSCHEAQARIEHQKVALDEHDRVIETGGTRKVTNCLSCHGFGPDPDKAPNDCIGCHDQAQGVAQAIALHADAPCQECHDVHRNEVRPVDCAECHPLSVEHAPHPGALASTTCLDCHDMHGPAALAEERCLDCHGEGERAAVEKTAAFGQHACTGCHRPHTFEKSDATDCKSCHTMSTMAGAAHTECKSCHEPHRVRESVREDNPCTKCHGDVAATHQQSPDAVRVCTTCHAPHPKTPHGGPSACTSCHADVARGAAHVHSQKSACTDCHAPHDFTAVSMDSAFCGKCHAERIALLQKHPGHKACADCHKNLPHGPDTSPIACTECHGDIGQRVNAGHQTCLGCHDGHTGIPKGKACESCHEREAALRVQAHRPCTACHDQHAGTPKPGVADCSACHDHAALPGLHGVAEHRAACTSCHEPHASTPPEARERCLSCHADQRDHQPEAKRCDGCHAFIGAGRRSKP